ncbi:phage tail protein [Mesorhizobium sp. M0045]|uniref:phage tail protein n=2 Tax=unclassified Mesorhizobium TaxID=325217 RepID=UPI003339E1D9
MKITATFHQDAELIRFLQKLEGPEMQQAAARGLNEHAGEQARQSVVRIAATTGVPAGRVRSKTRVVKAAPGPSMTAEVVTADVAIPLAEYGNPVWVRDLNPMSDGKFGGSVSSMRGAEATGWNVRRQFPHSFIANGQVVVRTTKDRFPLKVLSMAVLANELAKPTRPNVPASERFAALDLEKRVVRQVIRTLGL